MLISACCSVNPIGSTDALEIVFQPYHVSFCKAMKTQARLLIRRNRKPAGSEGSCVVLTGITVNERLRSVKPCFKVF